MSQPFLLSAQFLTAVSSVNDYQQVRILETGAGMAADITFQLLDMTKDRPLGRRYVPAAGALVTATLDWLDAGQKVIRSCTQPYPDTDPSIWVLPLYETDHLGPGTVNLALSLIEGSATRNGVVPAAFRFVPVKTFGG